MEKIGEPGLKFAFRLGMQLIHATAFVFGCEKAVLRSLRSTGGSQNQLVNDMSGLGS